jgi:hypothetical protein
MADSQRSLRLGLAGLGRFGQLHAAVLAQLPGVELAAVADPDAAALARTRERHRVEHGYGDALELIADPSLDAVVLATPDGQHHAQALAALRTGRPLFLEKPMAATWAEARELQRTAREQGTFVQVGLLLRHDLAHRLLQQQVASGAFGELVSIRCQRNCSRSSFAQIADRVHTVYRTLTHDIDLVLWLSGSRVVRVMASEYRRGEHLSPQGCFALLELASGCIAQLESSWFVPGAAPANVEGRHGASSIDAELALVGERQTARLRWLDGPLQLWSDAALQVPDTDLWPVLEGRVGGALREQMVGFCAAVRAGAAPLSADADAAVEGLRIAEAILQACATRQPVELGDAAAA